MKTVVFTTFLESFFSKHTVIREECVSFFFIVYVTIMLVLSGSGFPRISSIDSKVFRPIMTGCSNVSFLKRFRSSGICHKSFPFLPIARLCLLIATTILTIGFFMFIIYTTSIGSCLLTVFFGARYT